MITDNNIESPDSSTRYIEHLIGHVKQPPVDNTMIKNLVKAKIRQERRMAWRRRIFWSVSSAAAVVVIAVLAFSGLTHREISLATANQTELLSEGFIEVNVPRGERKEITLPDGSTVIANYNTRVVYPEKFNGKERRIYAFGEIFVDVTKDPGHPFIVESQGFEIKVLGTKFNINNRNELDATVVLVEGSIDLSTSKNQSLRLKPNDLVDLTDGEITELRKVDADDYIAWVNGLRNLNGETMSELTRNLSEYYGINIHCSRELAETKVYGKLDLTQNLDQAISSINNIIPMKVRREGNTIYLERADMN